MNKETRNLEGNGGDRDSRDCDCSVGGGDRWQVQQASFQKCGKRASREVGDLHCDDIPTSKDSISI